MFGEHIHLSHLCHLTLAWSSLSLSLSPPLSAVVFKLKFSNRVLPLSLFLSLCVCVSVCLFVSVSHCLCFCFCLCLSVCLSLLLSPPPPLLFPSLPGSPLLLGPFLPPFLRVSTLSTNRAHDHVTLSATLISSSAFVPSLQFTVDSENLESTRFERKSKLSWGSGTLTS